MVLGHQRWQDSRVRLPSAGSEDRRAWGASRRSARSTGALSTARWEQLPGLISRAMCLALGLVHRNRRALWTGAFTDPENPPHSFGFFSSLWRKAGVKRFMGPQPGPLPALLAIPSALGSHRLSPHPCHRPQPKGKAHRGRQPELPGQFSGEKEGAPRMARNHRRALKPQAVVIAPRSFGQALQPSRIPPGLNQPSPAPALGVLELASPVP